MLEFAYTGEVNVAQDLLPTLLHTARSYKIKGLDKVESPVDPSQVRIYTLKAEQKRFKKDVIFGMPSCLFLSTIPFSSTANFRKSPRSANSRF